MSFFGVFIPPSKAGFEGTVAQCAGSIAADNIKQMPANGSNDENNYEDPEYPPDSPLWLIFTEKSKALDVLRHYKEARLREFPNREQAESYVQFGFESIESLKRYGKAKPVSKPTQLPSGMGNNSGYKSSLSGTDSPYSSSPTNSIGNTLSVMVANGSGIHNTSGAGGGVASLNAERPAHRAPTKQELVEFRKQIEAGNLMRIARLVYDNPRYLISSGDTPTSLKEGYRYNAMHICAQNNQAQIAELLLKVVSDPDFTQLYAGKKSSSEMCAALNENLLDYYLNMPDKGRGETPLHFAVKYGHVDVVQVLTSFPQCKALPNTDAKYPKDIICQRAPNAPPETIKKLELLLTDPHYVPVLRTINNDVPPHIGQPFTPREPSTLHYNSNEPDRLSDELIISAVAGPMPREQAFNFFRRWKTPPRVGSNVTSPLAASPYMSPMKTTPSKTIFNRSAGQLSCGRRILFSPNTSNNITERNGNHKPKQTTIDGGQDENDSLEANNNNNNCAYKSSPTASTPMRQLGSSSFLEYRNNSIGSPFVEDLLDRAVSDFSLNVSNLGDSYRERHIKNSDVEKGLEMVGRHLARMEQLEWREYWDFLDTFIDIASTSGLERMESYLATKQEQNTDKSEQVWNMFQMQHCLDLIVDPDKPNNATATATAAASTQMTFPYTCVEKSLQVFAKRITKTLINNISNMVSINDTLLSELKRLKSLIVSFKEDARFITVDFGKVHHRIAHLVASYIANSSEISDATLCSQLIQMLRKLLQLNCGDRREHLNCMCRFMLDMLQEEVAVQLPEALQTEELCLAAWMLEQNCACLWDGNLSRKTSRRKRTESLRAQAQAQAQENDVNTASTNISSTSNAADKLRISTTTSNVQPEKLMRYRSTKPMSLHSDDSDSDDKEFFFECDSGQTSDEEVFVTPPSSRSPTILCAEPAYELFIFGKEPTKRDLDVLNAIFHVKIEKESLPLVHAWRVAMESFSTFEMDFFPSPTCVQKKHKPPLCLESGGRGAAALNGHNTNSVGSAASTTPAPARRLFGTPKLNAVATRIQPATPPAAAPSPAAPPAAAPTPATTPAALTPATTTNPFQTPLNKVRGLFSKYRDLRQEDTPGASIFDMDRIDSPVKESTFFE